MAVNSSVEYEKIMTLRLLLKVVQTVERGTHTSEHSDRVGNLAVLIGKEMKFPKNALLYRAGLLHDIGKIGVGNDIILSDKRLSRRELDVVHHHPEWGADIVKTNPSMLLESEIVLQHHENYDGTGYPQGLRGKRIMLASRILTISDTFDALVSARPYKPGWSWEDAFEFITDNVGKMFCPYVYSVFELLFSSKEIERIYNIHKKNY